MLLSFKMPQELQLRDMGFLQNCIIAIGRSYVTWHQSLLIVFSTVHSMDGSFSVAVVDSAL